MILLTADIHIKLGQKKVPKEWAINRFQMFLTQLKEAEKEASKVIIAGDIFDRIPTMEELTLYFKLVMDRKKPTFISTGNHEATKKGKSFLTDLAEVTEELNPLVKIIDTIYEDEEFYIVPYEFISKKSTWDSLEPKYVFTHVRGEIPPHVKPEIPLDWLYKFPTVFAGDLHSHSNTQYNIVYPGSPMTTSFHRNETDTGYIIINDDWTWEWKKFNLPQLLRKTVSTEAEMTPTEFHHTVYEIEGNAQEISNVDNDLLDKKILKRGSEAALILTPKMGIRAELKEYLQYIVLLKEDKTDTILRRFDEHYKTKNI